MGRTGFKTDHKLQDGFSKEGEYIVTNNVTTDLYSKGFKNPLPSTGQFLFINGFHYPRTAKRCWYDSVPVLPNTTYVFSCSVASVIKLNPPQLEFNVNGNSVSKIFYIFESNYWQTISTTYTTKSDQTRIEISIVDLNKVSSYGNDFAIDNIVFEPEKETTPVKKEEPAGRSTAQCIEGHCACTCTPLNETFGSASICGSPQNTPNAGIVNHTFIPYSSDWFDDNPADGEYSIRCNADELQPGWHLSPWADHTNDGSNVGFAAIINSGAGPREFYHKTLTGLCTASTYIVSFYAGNLTQTKSNTDLACNYSTLPAVSTYTFPANTSVQTESDKKTASFLITNRTGGALLGTTPDMPCTPQAFGMSWNLYSYEFTTGASQTSIDIVLVSLRGYNAGGDFSIDDIVVKKKTDCPPPNPELPGITPSVKKEEPVVETPSKTKSPVVVTTKPKPTLIIPPKTKFPIVVPSKPSYDILPRPKPPVLVSPKPKPRLVLPPKPAKKDTTTQMVAISPDFKKDISIEEIKVDQKLQLSHIYFERAKFNLLPASLPELNDLVIFMKRYPGLRIRLEGHTDNQGNPERNVELSENRAKEVKKYLVDQGIDENRIEWIGYGSQRPIYSDGDESLRQKNRRVEIVILSK